MKVNMLQNARTCRLDLRTGMCEVGENNLTLYVEIFTNRKFTRDLNLNSQIKPTCWKNIHKYID